MIAFIQTHDLVGNRIKGDRLSNDTRTDLVCALACIYLLSPQIPMLFMGEEWGASTPFPFFSDYRSEREIADMRQRRRQQLEKIKPTPSEQELAQEPDPQNAATYNSAKLDWEELQEPDHAAWLAFYRQLVAMRRECIIPLLRGLRRACGQARVISGGVFEVQWSLAGGAYLQLAANLSPRDMSGFTPMEGDALWAEGTSPGAESLGAYSVRWHLRSARACATQ